MKKRILAIMLAVMMVIAILPVSVSANAADDLAAQLKAMSNAQTVTLDVNTVLASDLTIPYGVTLIVPEKLKLTVNATLTVKGYVLVYGSISCDIQDGKILYPDHVIIMRGTTESTPLATYSCPFCGEVHENGTACPQLNGSYYCLYCKTVHPAGYVCRNYSRYQGYNTYYCQYCDKYHPINYFCPDYEFGSFRYCKTCDAYHIAGAVCGPLASPTKYYYDPDCGHFHVEGETVTHAHAVWCAKCGNYHAAGEDCVAHPTYGNFVYCALCNAYHIEGQHIYSYCSTCGTYHETGKHTLTWCTICKTYHAQGQHTMTFCPICGTYYANGTTHTHTVAPTFVPYTSYVTPGLTPYISSTNKTPLALNVFDTSNVSYSQLSSALKALGLPTGDTDVTYDGVRNLKNQDVYYIVYAALLKGGKINPIADDAIILSRFANAARISNIGAYKSALAFFAYSGVITNYSIDPRAAVAPGTATALINFASTLCR